jgi:hypothetical protein
MCGFSSWPTRHAEFQMRASRCCGSVRHPPTRHETKPGLRCQTIEYESLRGGLRMSSITRIYFAIVLIGAVVIPTPCGQRPATTNSSPNAIHGTVVVVISTKDGFVLAGDSRGQYAGSCTPAPGEYQKLFAVGKRSAIVVAGLIQISDPSNELADSIATHLIRADEDSQQGSQPLAATTAWIAFSAVQTEARLLDGAQQPASPIAQLSAVSVGENGAREWVTFNIAPIIRTNALGDKYVAVKVTGFVDPPESRVFAFGSGGPEITKLTDLSSPDPAKSYSQLPIMQKYYSLKRSNRLSELSLQDGKELAQNLMEAAIAGAPACSGVGGSIDVLVITKDGVEWVRKKSAVAASPPLYVARVFDSDLSGRIDGLECMRCSVKSGTVLSFSGERAVRLVQTKFEGPCEFVLKTGAEQAMPAVAEKLRSALGTSCDVFREVSATNKTLLTRATLIGHPSGGYTTIDYSAVCNSALRAQALEIVRKVREFVDADQSTETQIFNQEDLVRLQLQSRSFEERDVFYLRRSLLSIERSEDFLAAYRTQFAVEVRSLRYELSRRLKQQPGAGYGFPTAATTSQMYAWTDEIEKFAKALPDDCSADRRVGGVPFGF